MNSFSYWFSALIKLCLILGSDSHSATDSFNDKTYKVVVYSAKHYQDNNERSVDISVYYVTKTVRSIQIIRNCCWAIHTRCGRFRSLEEGANFWDQNPWHLIFHGQVKSIIKLRWCPREAGRFGNSYCYFWWNPFFVHRSASFLLRDWKLLYFILFDQIFIAWSSVKLLSTARQLKNNVLKMKMDQNTWFLNLKIMRYSMFMRQIITKTEY